MAAVEIEGLVVRHGRVTAVDGASFAVDAGEVVALLGVNGAGKTSTVEVVAGLARADGGRVTVLGLDPGRDRHRLGPRCGVMLQEGGLHPGARPAELLALQQRLHDVAVDPAPLATVGLTDRADTAVRRLSGGERQRLALVLAMVGRPEVLLLDEPTAGVDVTGRSVVRRLVAARRRAGVAVLLSTHELAEAERMADRVVVVDRGRVVADGTLDELRGDQAREELRFRTDSALDVVGLSAALDAHVAETGPGEYVVGVAPTAERIARLTAALAERGVTIEALGTGKATLEDVFVRLTANEADVTGPRTHRRRDEADQ